MSEPVSLSVALEKTIMDWGAANGGAFPMGYVAIIDFAAESGENQMVIAKQAGQPTVRSMGLASYLDLWFKDDAQRVWAHAETCDCDEDDDDE
jgi:hypothetical protein